MAFAFASSGAIVFKAGKNVNTSISTSGSFLSQISDEAEALINDTARIDLTANYSNLTSNGRKILQLIETCYGAMQLITWDLNSYTSKAESSTMLNVYDAEVRRGLELIRDDKIKTFLNAT